MLNPAETNKAVEEIRRTRDSLRTLADEAFRLYSDLRDPQENLVADAIRLGILPAGSRLLMPDQKDMPNDGSISWGGIIYKKPSLQIPSLGITSRLTPQESQIATTLLKAQGEIVAREQIIPGLGRTVDVHVRRLRAKVDPANIIESVRGYGYRAKAVK